jgi:ATP-dependent RNA helicase DDX31/DBP7
VGTTLQVHTKQRLVALAALLHSRAPSSRHGEGGGKVVVFLSTCAGVEFHHALLASAAVRQLGVRLPGKLFKLHGNLSQVRQFLTSCAVARTGTRDCTAVNGRTKT